MKKIDFKSVLIGLLIGTNLMFLFGANSKQKVQDVQIVSIKSNVSMPIRNNTDPPNLYNRFTQALDVRVIKE